MEKLNKKVTFVNEPKLMIHERDRESNEKRLALVPQIQEFVSNHPLFKDKNNQITFFHKGVSSLVSLIESGKEKSVLKISLIYKNNSSEGKFLSEWEKVGVTVPHVIEEGLFGEHPYVLMKYIDAPSLGEKYSPEEMIDKKIFLQMGQTLRKMHNSKADGFGSIVDGKPQYPDFETWVNKYIKGSRFQGKIKFSKDNNLLSDEEHGSLDEAINILKDFVEKDPQSTYCHDDFSSGNIFATEPLTVFDPNPTLNHPYLDLGRSIVIAPNSKVEFGEADKQILDGYFAGENFDRKALQASILLNAYMKFRYWHSVAGHQRIAKVQEFLKNTKHYMQ